MAILDQVQRDVTAAMKERNEAKLNALRMVKVALMKHQVDTMKPLDEAAEMQVLKSLIKQRQDASEMFRKAGREQQADKEDGERALIETYLPEPASDEEIESAVQQAISETGVSSLKNMGVVMKSVQSRLKGKTVDGKKLSEKVRSRLS